ncbi:MAG: tetraacyldisaccharide 4'-kinase, partial [Rhodoferax sp.]|nr:tetraacyldisaccharide 4'-kinase [Rhodoferax sp.]
MGKGPLTGLQDEWARRGPWAMLLWPLSWLYGSIFTLRSFLYRAGVLQVHHAQLPVVIVGNLVAGGAGKTPVVVELVRYLAAHGLRPGVLSRGYGRSASHCVEVLPDSAVAQVGDEPLLIRRKTGAPVFVARSRVEAARQLRLRHPRVDILVSDDGLQHYALHRDVEICVFDERGVGNGWLLPAGPLREVWPRNCDMVLDSGKLAVANRYGVHRRLGAFALRADGAKVGLSDLRETPGRPGKPMWAIAGIAQPEQFFSMLRAVGIVLKGSTALADH